MSLDEVIELIRLNLEGVAAEHDASLPGLLSGLRALMNHAVGARQSRHAPYAETPRWLTSGEYGLELFRVFRIVDVLSDPAQEITSEELRRWLPALSDTSAGDRLGIPVGGWAGFYTEPPEPEWVAAAAGEAGVSVAALEDALSMGLLAGDVPQHEPGEEVEVLEGWQLFRGVEVVGVVTDSVRHCTLEEGRALLEDAVIGDRLWTMLPRKRQERAFSTLLAAIEVHHPEPGLTLLPLSWALGRLTQERLLDTLPDRTSDLQACFRRAGVFLPRLRQIYRDDHGEVLFTRIPGALSDITWQRLSRAAAQTGYWPVLDYDELDLPARWEGELSTSARNRSASSPPDSGPAWVREAAEDVDLDNYLRLDGTSHHYVNYQTPRGPWPTGASPLLPSPYARRPEVPLVLVSVSQGWQAPTFILNGTVERPPAEAVVAVCRWLEAHGLLLYGMSGCESIVLFIAEPPKTRPAALDLALRLFSFSPDLAEVYEYAEALGEVLMCQRYLRLYWN